MSVLFSGRFREPFERDSCRDCETPLLIDMRRRGLCDSCLNKFDKEVQTMIRITAPKRKLHGS